MGLAAETLIGYLSAAAVTTRQSLTPGNSSTFTVRSAAPNSKAHLRSVWGNLSGAGAINIRSPRMHDAIDAVNLRAAASLQTPLTWEGFDQVLVPVDLLDVGVTFDAAPVAATIEGIGMTVTYDDLPGAQFNGRSWAEVQPQILNYYGQFVTPTTGATAGDWGAGVAINSSYDQLKAGTNYAVLGYVLTAACTAIALQGPDTGNYRFGGPGSTDPRITRGYFVDLAASTGQPLIPVIQANNKGATLVTAAGDAAGAAIVVGLVLAELAA